MAKNVLTIIAVVMVLFLLGQTGNAGPITDNLSGAPGRDFKIQNVLDILVGLSCWFAQILGILLIIAIIAYAIMIAMAQGNPDRYNTGKKGLQYALIGTIIILGVYVIIASVANSVGVDQADYYDLLPIDCSGFDFGS